MGEKAMRHGARSARLFRCRFGADSPALWLCLFPSSRCRWYTIYKDHVRLDDYEIHDGMGLELYYM
jgi:hypothetical protein